MKPQSAKAKGRRLQQKVRDAILSIFTDLEPDDVVSTSMGAGGEDLKLSPAARRVVPFQFEAKSRAKMAVYADYDQCRRHGSHEPVVVVQADRRKPLAVVDLAVFLDLVERAGCVRPSSNPPE